MISGVFGVGDTYDAQCECGWEATGFEDDASADEVLRIHQGEAHCPDCGALVPSGDDCRACSVKGVGSND